MARFLLYTTYTTDLPSFPVPSFPAALTRL